MSPLSDLSPFLDTEMSDLSDLSPLSPLSSFQLFCGTGLTQLFLQAALIGPPERSTWDENTVF